MEVIVIKDINNLGKEGMVIKVKEGYARNYLIPQGLALPAGKDNLKKIEELKRARAKEDEKSRKTFLALKEKIEAISVTINAQAKPDEELYGAINEGQILKALKEEGVDLEKGKMILDEPINKIGAYHIKVKLSSDVEANLRLWIVKS